MKRLIVCIFVVVLASCGYAEQNATLTETTLGVTRHGTRITRYHDDEKRVTCWLTLYGISCIPDSQLESK